MGTDFFFFYGEGGGGGRGGGGGWVGAREPLPSLRISLQGPSGLYTLDSKHQRLNREPEAPRPKC